MRRRRRSAGDDEVPRLPRGRWFGGIRAIELIRIGFVATALVILIVLGRPCADGMASFIESFAPPPDAGLQAPTRSLHLERLTEEEIRKRFPGGDEEPASPDAKATRPDAEATRAGEKGTRPDEKAIRPGEEATSPDAKATRPGEEATSPDAKATRPRRGSNQPRRESHPPR